MRHIPVPEIIKEIDRKAAEERLQERKAEKNLRAFLEYEDGLVSAN